MQGASRKRARRPDERRGEVRTSVLVTALKTLLLLPYDKAQSCEQADAVLAIVRLCHPYSGTVPRACQLATYIQGAINRKHCPRHSTTGRLRSQGKQTALPQVSNGHANKRCAAAHEVVLQLLCPGSKVGHIIGKASIAPPLADLQLPSVCWTSGRHSRSTTLLAATNGLPTPAKASASACCSPLPASRGQPLRMRRYPACLHLCRGMCDL